MPAPRGNGRTSTQEQAEKITAAIASGTDTVAQEKLFAVAAHLSRKLSWALSTSWEEATGSKPPRGVINDLAGKYAVELTIALRESFPLHLVHLTPDSPSASDGGS